MAGIPTESPLVLRESLGSSHNRLTSAKDYEEALLSGYPPVGLLDAKNVYHAEQKGNRLPRLTPARGITPIADHNSTGVRQSQLKSRKKVDSLENDSPGLLQKIRESHDELPGGASKNQGLLLSPDAERWVS